MTELRQMLTSKERATRLKGLWIFADMGRAAAPTVVAEALQSMDDPDWRVRHAVLNGIMSCADALDAQQAAGVLAYADDPEDLVREKVITLMGALDPAKLLGAINELPEPLRETFSSALRENESRIVDHQVLFDTASEAVTIAASLALALLERAARSGALMAPIAYSGGGYVGEAVCRNINRLARNAARSRARSVARSGVTPRRPDS